MAVAMLPAFAVLAQGSGEERFAIKPTVEIGFGDALSTGNAMPGMSTKSSSTDFGVDFGWTVWRSRSNSLEVNFGLGYGSTSLTADLGKLDYHYSAPAAADMDNDTYIRYYELSAMHQKIQAGRVTLPIYLNYRYETSRVVSLHALLGMKFGFSASSKVSQSSGTAYSYGIYPQYDNLLINATYMNEFGTTTLGADRTLKPETNGCTASLLVGAGAEIRLWGPLALDITLRYERGFNDVFKTAAGSVASIDADNAPVTYTVAEGQTVRPLSSYLGGSKISRLSAALSLICRF